MARGRRDLAQSDQHLSASGLGIRRRGLQRGSNPTSGASRTSIVSWPRPVNEASASSWTSCPTTPAIATRGSSTPARTGRPSTGTGTSGRTPSPTAPLPTTGDPSFGGPAWTWDEGTGQFYLHNFLPEQPDLNWWNPQVNDAFDDIVRFWLDRGVAGFRIDVAHALVKDRSLRDDTVALETGSPEHPAARPALGFQHEPAGGSRRPPTMAKDRRRLPRRPPRRDVGPRSGRAGALLRDRRGRAPPGAQRAVRLLEAGRGDARDRRTHRGGAARGRVAPLGRVEPRCRAVRDSVVRRRRATHPSRPPHASHAAGHAAPLLRRRDRDAERRCAPPPPQGPGRHPPLAGRSGPGQGPDADAVDERRRVLERRRRAVAPDG